ncbi:unnamed protein product [Closterium sp. NIES-64]|nr:unnamed protein product [Closterium sp. NIES-64]
MAPSTLLTCRATHKAVAPRAPALPLPPSMRAPCRSSRAPCFVAARALFSPRAPSFCRACPGFAVVRPRAPYLVPARALFPLVAPAPPHVAALLVVALPLASASSPPSPSSFPLSFVLRAPPYFFLLLFPLLLYYPSTPSAPSPSSSSPLSLHSPHHLTLSSASPLVYCCSWLPALLRHFSHRDLPLLTIRPFTLLLLSSLPSFSSPSHSLLRLSSLVYCCSWLPPLLHHFSHQYLPLLTICPFTLLLPSSLPSFPSPSHSLLRLSPLLYCCSSLAS